MLSVLKSANFKLYFILFVLASALAAAGYFYVDSLYTQIGDLSKKNTELVSKNSELSTKLRMQNDAVAQLKKDSDARTASHKAELEAAKRDSAVAKNKARVIYHTPPSNPNDLCASALDLVNGAAK